LDRRTLWLRGVRWEASLAALACAIFAMCAADSLMGDPVSGLMITIGPR
jgi:hypothetical protein